MNHILPLALLFAITTLADEPRTFTSKDGRSIQGEIVSATDKDASLKLTDGRRVTVPFTALSDKDVAAVKQWSKDQAQEKKLEKGVMESTVTMPPRTFTESSGNTFTASIKEATERKVTFLLPDGKTKDVPVTRLSAPDQLFVLTWMTKELEKMSKKEDK